MRAAGLLLLAGCYGSPPAPTQSVGYRDGVGPDQPNNGERGSLNISEVLWSGSVRSDGRWDPDDQFLEIRNEGNRPMNLSRWQIALDGVRVITFPLPDLDFDLYPGEHLLVAAKKDGCFPDADVVLEGFNLVYGEPFQLTLRDLDDRLIEPAGSTDQPPYAGGYDLVRSRSMEKAQLIFGGRGNEPESWHFYNEEPVEVPNDDRIAADCRAFTRASPGRPNSPDYSGAYSAGDLE
jgi:hypothetical protein